MAHVRTQVREAIVSALEGLPSTGSRVFESRMRSQDESRLPCILVLTDKELVDPFTFDGKQKRVLQVSIIGVAQLKTGLDAALDQIALEVEEKMETVRFLGGLVSNSNLQKIEVTLLYDLQKPCGQVELVYEYEYYTNAGLPGTII
jgi:hypothetical protein